MKNQVDDAKPMMRRVKCDECRHFFLLTHSQIKAAFIDLVEYKKIEHRQRTGHTEFTVSDEEI